MRSQIPRTLREAGVRRFSGIQVRDGGIEVRITDPADIDAARDALGDLAAPVTSGALGGQVQSIEIDEIGNQILRLTYTDVAINERQSQVVQQSIEVIRNRIDELGTRSPTIQRQGRDRIVVQVPGEDDPGRLQSLLQTTAKLTFRMVNSSVSETELLRGRVPPGTEILYEEPDMEGQSPRPWAVEKRIMVDGADLTDAQPGFDEYSRPAVNFSFNARGGKMFGDATRRNVGKPFALVLDNEVISAPVIQQPILGGSGQITGDFSVQEANDLAVLLRAGALPAPITVLEERTVGPDLGADSIAAGKAAAVIGLLIVIVFIAVAYGVFGIAADIALIVNLILIAGVLSLLQATLTLPGIAGIVLTIGMAVDANVLVFERIREEVRDGKGPIAAIENGYSRAMSTILDANITTLIAALLLFNFGSGPVKGFAVTLAIGIVTSVFTAVMVTRLIVSSWVRRMRPAVLKI